MEINGIALAGGGNAALPEQAAERPAESAAAAPVVQAVAAVDNLAADKVADNALGIYLNADANVSLPNWTVLTALRAYGLNLKNENEAAPVAAKISAPTPARVKESVSRPVVAAVPEGRPAAKAKVTAPAVVRKLA